MRSVRFRLLVLALLPMVVLLPLLLILATARWTADYDDVVIANIESDLRIAEQYLGQILNRTGGDVASAAQSTAFEDASMSGSGAFGRYLRQARADLELDFLYYLPAQDVEVAAARWPVIAAASAGLPRTAIDIFSGDDLSALSEELAQQARITLIETEAAVPTDRLEEDRGMVVHTASPVRVDGRSGVLVGGILLNRNLDFIDTINALVFQDSGTNRQGTATLFLEDVRVSTNVRLFEDVRALGTRVSAAVRGAVLDEGETWLDRAFVVNDWYISGYLPLIDSFGDRVGMLYVGFLEAPFAAAKLGAYATMIVAFGAVLLLSIPILSWLAKGIFAPLEQMTGTMKAVEEGDLTARNGDVKSRDEIGQVAAHLDTLLDQVQERDRKLRAWADELNTRVDTRTAELKEANQKLEDTFQQLVMSEKLASIGEITAGVAHEINNPVAVIQGNVDVMRQTLGSEAEEVRTELSLIDRQIERIDAIVGRLLQFARPSEYGTFEDRVDIAALVEDCLVLVDHVVSRQHVTVNLNLGEAPPVRINPGELQQVIINLVVNAAQAMPSGGFLTLTLDTETREGKVGARLTVADTGPGIPEAHIGNVFDPFYTTKQAEGTGLGLSISQTLIRGADGRITVRNRPEGGAEFVVWLPGQMQEAA